MKLFPENRQKLIDTLMAYAQMLLNKEATADQIENARLAVETAQADFSPQPSDAGEQIPAGTWSGATEEGATLAPEAQAAGSSDGDRPLAEEAQSGTVANEGTDDGLTGDAAPDLPAELAGGDAPVEQSGGLADA